VYISRPERPAWNMQSLAYERLRDAIVKLELRPGHRLNPQALADQLGTGRTQIRSALARLRDDELVVFVRRSGMHVAPISAAAIEDAQFAREGIECAAIRVAATRVVDDDGTTLRLETIIRRQEAARDTCDYDRFYALDDAFHRSLCELGGHEGAWSPLQNVVSHLNRVRRASLPQPGYMTEMLAGHRLVLDRLIGSDPRGTEAALRHHLTKVASAIGRIHQTHPDYFTDDWSDVACYLLHRNA
jgi:GntR family transcriptional regulator, rspAB operon transcriptional repressor